MPEISAETPITDIAKQVLPLHASFIADNLKGEDQMSILADFLMGISGKSNFDAFIEMLKRIGVPVEHRSPEEMDLLVAEDPPTYSSAAIAEHAERESTSLQNAARDLADKKKPKPRGGQTKHKPTGTSPNH